MRKKLNFKNYPKTIKLLCLAIFVIFIGTATALIFISRAGEPMANNWPVSWDLINSDNGVLYQLSDDIFSGKKLDWSFSPQVYIFPEIPISLLSYGLAGGNVYAYFILVAILNNIIFFISIFLLLRFIYSSKSFKQNLLHSVLSTLPLVILPLITSNTLFAYHLAPTYYFGSYLLILAMPYILFGNNKLKKSILATIFAFTAASNPLLLAFCLPATILVFIIMYFKIGFKHLIKPATYLLVTLLASIAIRFVLFSNLVGTSPENYLSIALFEKHLRGIVLLLQSVDVGKRNIFTFSIGFASLLVSAVMGLFYSRKYLKAKGSQNEVRYASLTYINFVPISAFVGLYLTTSINTLYLWPIIVMPIIFVLMSIESTKLIKPVLFIQLAILVVLLARPSNIVKMKNLNSTYFNYRSEITKCLDQNLPENHKIGYATFSDSRPITITSKRNITLVPILSHANPSNWLSNKRYSSDSPGSFFVINLAGDETPILKTAVEAKFGPADSSFNCSKDIEVFLYNDQSDLLKIKMYYQDFYNSLGESK